MHEQPETLYKKVGRKYEAVSAYTSMDSFPNGAHLVVVDRGFISRRKIVDPAIVPLLAAAMVMRDKLPGIIHNKSVARLPVSYTDEQRTKFTEHFVDFQKKVGANFSYVEYPSTAEVAEEILNEIQKEAEKLLCNEATKLAYEHFLLLCKLSDKKENE